MDKLKYNSKEEIMMLPTYQRKKYLKKLKNYGRRLRKREKKEREKQQTKGKEYQN